MKVNDDYHILENVTVRRWSHKHFLVAWYEEDESFTQWIPTKHIHPESPVRFNKEKGDLYVSAYWIERQEWY